MSQGKLSEAPYSPESSGSSSGQGSNNGQPSLIVTRQPPSHEFADAWIVVEVRVEAPSAFLAQHGGSPAADAVDVLAELCRYDDKAERPGDAVPADDERSALILDPSSSGAALRAPVVESASKSRRTARLRFKIRSAVHSDRLTSYCIRFSAARGEGGGPPFGAMPPVFTNPITMVSAKLRIDARDWEKIWYKDEGGRDKCMSVEACLCSRDGSLEYQRRIPLRLTLLYDNEQSLKVLKQETLRVLGPPKRYIDPETAKTSLQFRIEDVSKNHQGMDFKVEVAPDVARAADVAPACTPPVSIRSKRNKRQRSSLSGPGVAAARPQDSSAAAAQGGPPGGGGASLPPRSPVRAFGDRGGGQLRQQEQGFAGVSDVARLRQAMKGVIQWTEEVVNGLYPLKWQVIGYAQFPDGTVDYNRPYHSMPNPNATISRVLSMYSEETRDHLRALLTAVENTRSPTQHDTRTSPPSAPFGMVEPQPIGQPHPQAGGQAAAKARPLQQQQQQMADQSPIPVPYGIPPGAAGASYGAAPRQQGMGSPWDPMAQQQQGGMGAPPPYHPPLQQQQQQQYPHPQRGAPMRMGEFPRAAAAAAAAAAAPTMAPPPRHPGAAAARAKAPPGPSDLEAMHERRAERDIEDESRQAEVEYVLAKQYKSMRSGERLGFPAFSASRELLGFFRESSMKVGVGQFIPISKHADEFGPAEMAQASRILGEAIAKKSQALHALKDWGSVANLVDHALVYDWSKDIGPSNSDPNDEEGHGQGIGL